MKYLVTVISILFLSRPLIANISLCRETGGQWSSEENKCYCKPKFENFKELSTLPWVIQECFKKPPVVKACYLNDCFPLTHIGNGVFLTAQHTLAKINQMEKALKDLDVEELKKELIANRTTKPMDSQSSKNPTEPAIKGKGKVNNLTYSFIIFVDGNRKKLKVTLLKKGIKPPNDRENYNHDWDLAAFQIQELAHLPSAKLADADQKLNTSIYSIAPNNDNETFKGYLYSSGSFIGTKDDSIKTDHLGIQGHSGGPIFNGRCELVGLFWGKETTLQEDPMGFDKKTVVKAPFDPQYGCPQKPLKQHSYSVSIPQIKKFLSAEVPSGKMITSPTNNGAR